MTALLAPPRPRVEREALALPTRAHRNLTASYRYVNGARDAGCGILTLSRSRLKLSFGVLTNSMILSVLPLRTRNAMSATTSQAQRLQRLFVF